MSRGFEGLQTDVNRPGTKRTPQQQSPSNKLTHGGGDGGSGNTQVECEDKEGVEDDVQYRSRADAYHSQCRVALQSKLIVKREGGHHERGGQQDVAEIIASCRDNVWCGTQRYCQLRKVDESDTAGPTEAMVDASSSRRAPKAREMWFPLPCPKKNPMAWMKVM